MVFERRAGGPGGFISTAERQRGRGAGGIIAGDGYGQDEGALGIVRAVSEGARVVREAKRVL